MAITKIDHFGVEVPDLEAVESFYRHVLGLTVVMRLADQILFQVGDARLAVFEHPRAAPDPEDIRHPLGKAHVAFQIPAEELAHWAERLDAAGAPTREVDWGDHRCLYFLDPVGTLLEVVTPAEAKG